MSRKEQRAASRPVSAAERARPLRADAVRNREALLEAARTVFRRDGLAVQMEAIAEQAGLGMGTLYRHFSTRDGLLTVLVEERLAQLTQAVEAARATDDPWEAVARLIWQLAAFEAADRALADILTQATQPAVVERLTDLTAGIAAVVQRAQAAGVMRADIAPQDVMVAICGIGKMMPLDATSDPERWKRLVPVFIDGLRVPRANAAALA